MASRWGRTIQQLRSQRKELQEQADKITEAINVLKSLDGNEGTHGVVGRRELKGAGGRRKRRRFSAATRKKMAAAQRARWAKVKGENK
jgi:hypothetical protein